MPTKETKRTASKPAASKERTKEPYVEAVGRRKTAVARVRLYTKEKAAHGFSVEVNGRKFTEYFPFLRGQQEVTAPFAATGTNYPVTAKIEGGGTEAQVEALRLGIARALVSIEGGYRGKLKGFGYLTRDPRMVERKKFGSRKARRPQQWRKR